MKILRIAVAVLVVALLLVGCRPTGRAAADYRERPFRAEVRWERGGVTVYAEAETVMENGALMLSYVRLLAPPSLAGIEMRMENGALVLLRDGIRMTATGAKAWWETVSLLCASGSLTYVCDTEWAGLSLEYAEISDGEAVVEVLREPTTGVPKRITQGEISLTVIRFEPIVARE